MTCISGNLNFTESIIHYLTSSTDSWLGLNGSIVNLLLAPEVVPGIPFRHGETKGVYPCKRFIDRSSMLYGSWLSNITCVNDKVVLGLIAIKLYGQKLH